jgi:serine/threonine-protein kinase
MSRELHRLPDLDAILRPGQIVDGRYRIDRLIGEGGMAAVWAGHNERTGKRVALKVILGSMATVGEAAELFRGEALTASKINHPNVVSIFDVIDHGSLTCIVMELLDGETLDFYLARNGPRSLQETVALLLPAMRGVAAAHAQGVVHRDLKPGNIFLCSDADGRLLTSKVLDFGIATMMGQVGGSALGTHPLVRMGTPTYMSPEAIQCSPDIDGRTDVYGFGVLIFEALTGHVPFPGEPGIELFVRILDDPPPRVTEYRSDLPSEVVQIVDRALAKNADDRFPDMEHLIRAVEDELLPHSQVPRALTPMRGVPLEQLVESKSDAAFVFGTVGEVIRKEPSGPASPSKPGGRFSLTGLSGFAVAMAVAVGLTVAARSNHRSMGKQESRSSLSPVTLHGPQVVPLATTPSPAALPSASNPGRDTIRPIAQAPVRVPSKGVMRKADSADRPRTTTSRNRSAAPRAGRLSSADF